MAKSFWETITIPDLIKSKNEAFQDYETVFNKMQTLVSLDSHKMEIGYDDEIKFEIIKTPLGLMIAGNLSKKLCLLEFYSLSRVKKQMKHFIKLGYQNFSMNSGMSPNEIDQQLDFYFCGKLQEFETSLKLIGTDFQIETWNALAKIQFSDTITYTQLAKRLGNVKKVRAVANANAENPIAIIIPCHRVVGKKGALTGYAGGLWRKQLLLEMEKYYEKGSGLF